MTRREIGKREVQKPATRTEPQVDVATTLPEAMTGRASPAKAAVGDKPAFAYFACLPQPQRGIAEAVDALAAMIITLDDPLTVAAHPDARQAPAEYETLLGGLHTTPALITHEGRQSGIQVGLKPLGARALLSLPAGELASLDFHAGEVLGRVASEVQERVRAAAAWSERFAILDQVLLQRLEPARGAPPAVVLAWRILLASGGSVTVRQLTREVGWSGRHLQERFREEVGLTPKAAGRVIRFDLARRKLQNQAARGDLRSLADLAADCGYFDQAHLARDFRDLAGAPPSQWLRDEFRNVQVPAVDHVAELAP